MSNFKKSLSVIIPTFNEEQNVGELIKLIHQYGGNTLKEIIVSDAGSSDKTVEVACNCGAVIVNNKRKSRSAQMNSAAAIAQGSVLYFVHADVLPPESFAKDIIQAINEGYKMGAYRSRFNEKSRRLQLNAWMTRFKLLFCRGGDQTLFVTRKHFQELNGFDETYVIMEDYDIIQRSWRNNKFKVFDKTVLISTRKYNSNSFLLVNLVNLWMFILYYVGTNPERMAKTYKRLLK
jgi:rSAM/selenodomain-associated transferase 2